MPCLQFFLLPEFAEAASIVERRLKRWRRQIRTQSDLDIAETEARKDFDLIRIQQGVFAGLLLNPFGKSVTAFELDGQTIRAIRRSSETSCAVRDLTSLPLLRNGWLGSAVSVFESGNRAIVVRGVPRRAAQKFCAQLSETWRAANLAAFETELERFSMIADGVEALAEPRSYPSACIVDPLLKEARAIDAELLSRLLVDTLAPDIGRRVSLVQGFAANSHQKRAQAIDAFVACELEKWKDFFDTVESKPLTPEQRLSVVVDEDASLVLAGAGSGKTSVITAKAAYLVRAGVRKPEEILLLAFGKRAAEEVRKRVEQRAGARIEAKTFHALAYDIIGKVEREKPPLASHATDELAFLNLLKTILKDLVRTASDIARAIISWFAHFFVEPKDEWDFKTKHAFYAHIEKYDLRTLQGEVVKSYEELQIANWLYRNGISYEYEPTYEHTLPSGGRRKYCPDFRLTESGVYIEHFGVRRKKSADGKEQLFTAPFVDREEYLAGMDWKRKVHAEHQTVLIETYSYERQEGRLLSSLAEKLAPYITLRPLSPDKIFDRVVELNQVDAFSMLLGTFLRKFKSGGYSLQDCRSKAERLKQGLRANAFLSVFAAVYEAYQKSLGDRIDFEDMIHRAARHVEAGRYLSPFRHILVDEFQDISQGRARLLKALKAQHTDSRLFAVGDDWQSIFRFAGADIHLMRNFGSEFGGVFDRETAIHRVVDLGRTFRSVDQIAYAARTFVLRNPAQIAKEVVPAGIASELAIRVVQVERGEAERQLMEVLRNLSAKANPEKGASVLLLGRYRILEPNLSEIRRSFPRLQISFYTIHASKGSEADHVILLNASSGRNGFPSEIVDDPLLALVSPDEETFENAEERRLMYVAMTRARYSLTIIASNSQPSTFVTELLGNPEYKIATQSILSATDPVCGECGGRLIQAQGQQGQMTFRCEHQRLCGNTLPPCPSCRSALPMRQGSSNEMQCDCGVTYPKCPKCNSGWLVERSGRFGVFHSCIRFPVCDGKMSTRTKGGGLGRVGAL